MGCDEERGDLRDMILNAGESKQSNQQRREPGRRLDRSIRPVVGKQESFTRTADPIDRPIPNQIFHPPLPPTDLDAATGLDQNHEHLHLKVRVDHHGYVRKLFPLCMHMNMGRCNARRGYVGMNLDASCFLSRGAPARVHAYYE